MSTRARRLPAQALLLCAGSIQAALPILAATFAAVIACWLRAVNTLGTTIQVFYTSRPSELAMYADNLVFGIPLRLIMRTPLTIEACRALRIGADHPLAADPSVCLMDSAQREEAEAAAQAETEKQEAAQRKAVRDAAALRTTDFVEISGDGRSNHSEVSRLVF